jgi:hypothetical protein
VVGLVVAGAATHGPGIEAVMISGAEAADALWPGLLSGAPDQPRTTPTGDLRSGARLAALTPPA